jgi:hypothetical protein
MGLVSLPEILRRLIAAVVGLPISGLEYMPTFELVVVRIRGVVGGSVNEGLGDMELGLIRRSWRTKAGVVSVS